MVIKEKEAEQRTFRKHCYLPLTNSLSLAKAFLLTCMFLYSFWRTWRSFPAFPPDPPPSFPLECVRCMVLVVVGSFPRHAGHRPSTSSRSKVHKEGEQGSSKHGGGPGCRAPSTTRTEKVQQEVLSRLLVIKQGKLG